MRPGGPAPSDILAPRRRSGGGLGVRCPGLEVRLLRSLVVALALSCIITSVPAAAAPSSIHLSTRQARAATQADDRLAAAADAARELSKLEAARDFDALYERMHPDALAVVPRSAVVGGTRVIRGARNPRVRGDRCRARALDMGGHGRHLR